MIKEEECEKGCPVGLPCQHYAHDKIEDCKHWKKTNKDFKKQAKEEAIEIPDGFRIAWTGNSLGMKNLQLIAERSKPIVIGVLGLSDAGKTTFLSMIYLMLLSGKKIGDWKFVSSYTLRGWENIINGLKWSPGNVYEFPAHTSLNAGRTNALLHLTLRKNGKTKDVVFTDVAGEWFSNWAIDKNSPDSKGAVWIQDNADAFIFLADSKKLASTEPVVRSKAINDTLSILSRLEGEIKNRKLLFLWAKADEKENIKSSIVERIERKMKGFERNKIQQSGISYKANSAEDVFRNNILNTVELTLNHLVRERGGSITISPRDTSDLFLTFRGH